MKKCFILSTAFFALGGTAIAQNSSNGVPEGYVALMRSDVQTQKVEIIRQNMKLTDEQSKGFWLIQRSYENDLSKLGDQRLEVIRDYAKNWDSLSDTTAKDLGDRLIDYQKKRVDLRKKYFDRMSKGISPTVAARFFQIETQLEDIIDLAIASSVPLVK